MCAKAETLSEGKETETETEQRRKYGKSKSSVDVIYWSYKLWLMNNEKAMVDFVKECQMWIKTIIKTSNVTRFLNNWKKRKTKEGKKRRDHLYSLPKQEPRSVN